MEIRTNGNLVFFLATFSRTNGNFGDFLSNETVFHSFVAIYSRTNGNLIKNACSRNQNIIPFVRERTVPSTRHLSNHGDDFGSRALQSAGCLKFQNILFGSQKSSVSGVFASHTRFRQLKLFHYRGEGNRRPPLRTQISANLGGGRLLIKFFRI